jgi:hypothetical protein
MCNLRSEHIGWDCGKVRVRLVHTQTLSHLPCRKFGMRLVRCGSCSKPRARHRVRVHFCCQNAPLRTKLAPPQLWRGMHRLRTKRTLVYFPLQAHVTELRYSLICRHVNQTNKIKLQLLGRCIGLLSCHLISRVTPLRRLISRVTTI